MFARIQEALSSNKKKKVVSVQELKSLHVVMADNRKITPANTNLVVESLRSIAELLIWGDQNDPKVFEYFLENNMIGFFDEIMIQDIAVVNVQLLQTMVLLLDNISTPTSIWFLLSNNHMNCIITHEFDFSQEEVLAYFISFLRSLSMRMTNDTILFFHNEHLPEFPLFSEAVKYLNHTESMVRVAVRTLTLSIFRAAIGNDMTSEYLLNEAVPPYFSSLVRVLGNLGIEMTECLSKVNHKDKGRLGVFVDEHLDLFHYISDVMELNFTHLTKLLTSQLMDSLLIPLYVHRLRYPDKSNSESEKTIGLVAALYLATHAFLIFDNPPMINALAATIFLDDLDQGNVQPGDVEELPFGLKQLMEDAAAKGNFIRADNTHKEIVAESDSGAPPLQGNDQDVDVDKGIHDVAGSDGSTGEENTEVATNVASGGDEGNLAIIPDDEQVHEVAESSSQDISTSLLDSENADDNVTVPEGHGGNSRQPVMLYDLLECKEDDVVPLLTMTLLYGVINNRGLYVRILREINLERPSVKAETGDYDHAVVSRLIGVIKFCTDFTKKARLITLGLAWQLLQALTMCPPEETEEDPGAMAPRRWILSDEHRTQLQEANDLSIAQLAQMFEEIGNRGIDAQDHFIDTFEVEFSQTKIKVVKVPIIMNQGAVLLQPSTEDVPGLDFDHRATENAEDRARRSIQIFLLSRKYWLAVNRSTETVLPLMQPEVSIAVRDALDLNNNDLTACNVISRGKNKQLMQVRRFMMVDRWRLVLMESSATELGWGIVRFIANLNEVVVCPESHNTRALQVVIRERNRPVGNVKPGHTVLFSGRFVFDDHIRCVAALQYLERGKANMRAEKISTLQELMGIRKEQPDPDE